MPTTQRSFSITTSILILFALNCIDLLTTLEWIAQGHKEYNPIMKFYYDIFGEHGMAFSKFFLITAGIVVIEFCRVSERRGRKLIPGKNIYVTVFILWVFVYLGFIALDFIQDAQWMALYF